MTFCQENIRVSLAQDFVHGVFHIMRSEKLPFFDIDRFAGAGGCDKKVCLTAEERGDLENIQNLCGLFDLDGFMNIGENRNIERIFNVFKNLQASRDSGASVGGY